MMPFLRFRFIIIFLVTVALLLLGGLICLHHKPSHVSPVQSLAMQTAELLSVSHESNNTRGLRIALINTPIYHFEVLLPLLHALGNQYHVRLDLFATRYGTSRHSVLPLINQQVGPEFLRHSNGKLSIQEPYVLRETSVHYDIMVFTSCSRDLEYFNQDKFLNPQHAASPREILCIMHEAHEWSVDISTYRNMVQPWIDTGRVTFVGLSTHVSQYFSERVTTQWKMSKNVVDVFEDFEFDNNGKNISTRVLTFPPIFEPKPVIGIEDMKGVKGIEPSFGAIQGKYEPERRNYNKIIDSVANNTDSLVAEKASIRFLGYGELPPTIPDRLKSLIYVHDGLSYPAFYTLLGRGNAIIPAFAHDLYYVDRASSTVAASVIVGTPIVASYDLINAYTYLELDGVWPRDKNESEIEAWVKAVEQGKEAWKVKKKVVAARRGMLIKLNLALMKKMLEMVRKRIDAEENDW